MRGDLVSRPDWRRPQQKPSVLVDAGREKRFW